MQRLFDWRPDLAERVSKLPELCRLGAFARYCARTIAFTTAFDPKHQPLVWLLPLSALVAFRFGNQSHSHGIQDSDFDVLIGSPGSAGDRVRLHQEIEAFRELETKCIEHDVGVLERYTSSSPSAVTNRLINSPLFALEEYEEDATERIEQKTGQSWLFWKKWFRSLVRGEPLDWQLQNDIANIPDDEWMKGIDHIGGLIVHLESRRLADNIKEKIEFSSTGRLTVVPQAFNETQHLGQLLVVVRDTLDLASGNLRNGLPHDCYQVQVIDRALTRYGNDPQRIEMDFERAKVSLMQDMAEDSIPVSAANRDLVQALGDAAGSIRESNPDIAANRERLNRIRLSELSEEDAEKVAEVAVSVAEISEGTLKEDLLEDRFRLPGVKRDDGLPDPVVPIGGAERNAALEAQAAQLRVYSRLAKVWLFAIENKETVDVAGGIASVIGAVLAIVTMVSASK